MISPQVALGGRGCPIRRSRDQRSLASPPGFSQRATSFVASQCQGIHQMPFFLLDPPTPSWTRPRRAKDLRASPKRRPGTPPRTGASPDRTPARKTPRTLRLGAPRDPQHPQAPRPQRGVSHEDTSSDGPNAPARACAPGPVRLGHIHKFASPDQSTPSRRRRRRCGTRPPGRPGPRNKTWSSPNAVAG